MKQPTLAYYTEELAKSQARLTALNGQGTQALSRYDIEIASQGNAEEALRTAKRLVRNHIAYFTAQIAELKKQPTQLSLFSQTVDTRIRK
jgi:50S ribosomal subunit-associated GTPase HflX